MHLSNLFAFSIFLVSHNFRLRMNSLHLHTFHLIDMARIANQRKSCNEISTLLRRFQLHYKLFLLELCSSIIGCARGRMQNQLSDSNKQTFLLWCFCNHSFAVQPREDLVFISNQSVTLSSDSEEDSSDSAALF